VKEEEARGKSTAAAVMATAALGGGCARNAEAVEVYL
jgi:hypothetical protein